MRELQRYRDVASYLVADGTAAIQKRARRRRAQARRLLASQLEGLYHLPFGKFERLTPAGPPAQVAEALAPYRAAGAAYITLVPAAASPEAGVEHAAAVRAVLDQVS